MILQSKQLRPGWVSDLPKVTEHTRGRADGNPSLRGSPFFTSSSFQVSVFPAGIVAAQPKPILLSLGMSQCLSSSPPPPALASLVQVARTTEHSTSTRLGPPQPASRGQRRQQKSVLRPLVKETQGVCFPAPQSY